MTLSFLLIMCGFWLVAIGCVLILFAVNPR